MATLEQCADELQGLIDACVARAGRFRFDIGNGQHCAAVSLLGTTLDLAGDFLLLLRRRSSASPKVILRSLLEACVDLHNLAERPEYLNNMQVAQLRQQLKAYREAKKPEAADNPYFRTVRVSGEGRAAEIEAELEELERHGFKELNIRQRFERAGDGDRYTSVYYLLCLDSHHNLGALERRHFIHEQDGHAIAFFKPETDEQLVLEADAVAANIGNAVADVSRLLDGEFHDMDQVGERLAAFVQARKALLAEQREEEE